MRIAAWWNTTSIPAISVSRSGRFRMSPATILTGPLASAHARLSRLPRTKLSTTTISAAPALTSSSTMWEPMKPTPPVTSARQPRSGMAARSDVGMRLPHDQHLLAQRRELALERLDARQQIRGIQTERRFHRADDLIGEHRRPALQ